MDVWTISLVGVSVVFLGFFILFFLFKVLAAIFGEDKPHERSVANSSNSGISKIEEKSEENSEELVAVISAAVSAYSSKDFRILSIRQEPLYKNAWRNHKYKIFRPLGRGDKKGW